MKSIQKLTIFILLLSSSSSFAESSCLGLFQSSSFKLSQEASLFLSNSLKKDELNVARLHSLIFEKIKDFRIDFIRDPLPLEESLRSEATLERLLAYQEIRNQKETINLQEFSLVAENFLRGLLSSDSKSLDAKTLQEAKKTLVFLLEESPGRARARARRALYEEILFREIARAHEVGELDRINRELADPILAEITSESRLLDFLTKTGEEGPTLPMVARFITQLKFSEEGSLYRVLDFIETHLEMNDNSRALSFLNVLKKAPREEFSAIRSSLLRALGRLDDTQAFERFSIYWTLLNLAPNSAEAGSLNALLTREMEIIEEQLGRESSKDQSISLSPDQKRLLTIAIEALSRNGSEFDQTMHLLRWLEKGDQKIQSVVLSALSERANYTSDQRRQIARILLEFLISTPNTQKVKSSEFIESITKILTGDPNPSVALNFLGQLLERVNQPQFREIEEVGSLDVQIALRAQRLAYVRLMREIEVAVSKKSPKSRLNYLGQLERLEDGVGSSYDKFWIDLLLSEEPALEAEARIRFQEIPLRAEDILALSVALNHYENLESLDRGSLKIERALNLLALNQADPSINRIRFAHLEILLRRITDPELINTALKLIKVEFWSAYEGIEKKTALAKGPYSKQIGSMSPLVSTLLSKVNHRNVEAWGIELDPQSLNSLSEILITLQKSRELTTESLEGEVANHQSFVDAVNVLLSGAIYYNGHDAVLSDGYATGVIELVKRATPDQIKALVNEKSLAANTQFNELLRQIQGVTGGSPGIKALKSLAEAIQVESFRIIAEGV